MQLMKTAGVTGIPLLLLTLVILVLIVRAAVQLRRPGAEPPLVALLFWGFAAAVLGFLGQCAGIYNGLTAIAGATEIDPRIVSRGLAESFVTTLWGGALLIVAGLAWLLLRTLGRIGARGEGSAA